MVEKGIYSPAVRKLGTILLFAGISGFFILIYYFFYLPQQHALFNQRAFRILHEIADNFITRVENYGISYSDPNVINNKPDPRITINDLKNQSPTGFAETFKASFNGTPFPNNLNASFPELKTDSIIYHVRQNVKPGGNNNDTSQSLNTILDPIISIHANFFESVLLIKQIKNAATGVGKNGGSYDSILYKSATADIADIDTDSILKNNFTQAPVVTGISLEGISYKMFLLPFQVKKIPNQTFVLAALLSEKSYRQQSQTIPVNFLIYIGLIFIILLLALPFLKIFVLSFHENINIADVRFIISVIFIIPFVVTLACSAIWLYKYPETFTNEVLSSLQNNITSNLTNEINLTIQQAKDYNNLIDNPKAFVNKRDSLDFSSIYSTPGINTPDIKDLILYPYINKNIENVHWMNADGNDIAAWNFTKKRTSYFQLKDRQYFKDIKDQKKYLLPGIADTFSIQPTLSKLTGEYTITIAIPARVTISKEKKAIALGISSKMLSVYKTVIPAGFGYCLVDARGDIVCHSDTARCLQENLFDETNNEHDLKTALGHRDSVLIDDINLYDEPVKMMVKPVDGLPYYLVTYYRKRSEYLFIFHITAFVFVCESLLLLLVSLFSYFMILPEKRISKLYFNPATLNWLKPSASKQKFYIRNCIQLLVCIFFVCLFSFFIPPADFYIYMINCSVLLPLFGVTGYYIIKRSCIFINFFKQERQSKIIMFFSRKQFLLFLKSIKNILLIYGLSILVYAILQNTLFYNEICETNNSVKFPIGVLIFLLPVFICLVAGVKFHFVRQESLEVLKRFIIFNNFKKEHHNKNRKYLHYFIISLLLSVIVITVIPTLTFTSYALHQERKLHMQSFQMHLASEIQERRVEVNNKLIRTKLDLLPGQITAYADSLKFSTNKGLYLYNQKLDTLFFDTANSSHNISCSPFYKIITKFLFLPPDHDEFYDNPSHHNYYYWQQSDNENNDSLKLYYRNITDNSNSSSISLATEVIHFSFFKDMISNWQELLALLAICIFIILFYKLIYAVAKRIYLVDFFNEFDKKNEAGKPEKNKDTDWLKQKLNEVDVSILSDLASINPSNVTFAEIREKENELFKENKDGGEFILKMHLALEPVYQKIWSDCSDVEKYTLYNFALDGFTNYKKGTVLYQLLKKGLMIKVDDNFTLMTISFRNFLITKETSEDIKRLGMQQKGSWAAVRTFFIIVLLAVAVFIFISQEEATKRLITIATSLGALLPLILKLFDKNTSASSVTKPGS
ncbi:MAG: hypothetical protein JWQ09_3788 [Segetibacter sp.]|nr:hypothetical protein [Segetibacter sp.]